MRRTAAMTAKIETRRAEVAKRILAGYTYRQIAAELGIAVDTVRSDVQVIRERWQKEQRETLEEFISFQRARLMALVAGLWSKAQGGDVKAAEAILRIAWLELRLLGFGKLGPLPKPTEESEPMDLSKLTDEELTTLQRITAKAANA